VPRPHSKIIKFPVGINFLTIEIAFAAAVAHSEALLAAGWSVPAARVQWEGLAAGVFIGILEPSLADPVGTERIDYDSDYWNGVNPP
jgi:hypothetical protein